MSLRSVILDELAASERIVRNGNEVVPRYHIGAPDGEYIIFAQVSDDLRQRERRMQLIAGFMAWTFAQWFVLAGQLVDPDAISECGISRDERIGALKEISRSPLSFGEVQWFDSRSIGEEIIAMLAGETVALDAETLRQVVAAFGENGELEAKRVN